jgi:flagellar FliL protein
MKIKLGKKNIFFLNYKIDNNYGLIIYLKWGVNILIYLVHMNERETCIMENNKEKKDGSKLKIIVITVAAVIVLGAGGYFGYNHFLASKENTTKKVVQQQIPVQQMQQGQQMAQNGSYLQQVVSAKTFGLDEFLVNLADEDGKRYLKVKVFLGYDNKKLDAELEEKKPILRDAVISVLRSKKSTDITSKGIESIKMEIIQRINATLEKGQLNNVYFNDLLVQ